MLRKVQFVFIMKQNQDCIMCGKGSSFPLPGSCKRAESDAAVCARSGSARGNDGSNFKTAAPSKQASEYKNTKPQSNTIMRPSLNSYGRTVMQMIR